MKIEIPDELAIELADEYGRAFSSSCCDGDDVTNYFGVMDAVGKLLVFIPDPRAPEPVDIADIPVTTLVLDPSSTTMSTPVDKGALDD